MLQKTCNTSGQGTYAYGYLKALTQPFCHLLNNYQVAISHYTLSRKPGRCGCGVHATSIALRETH